MESLRVTKLFPLVPIRRTTRPVKIGQYALPENTLVNYALPLNHNDKRVWQFF